MCCCRSPAERSHQLEKSIPYLQKGSRFEPFSYPLVGSSVHMLAHVHRTHTLTPSHLFFHPISLSRSPSHFLTPSSSPLLSHTLTHPHTPSHTLTHLHTHSHTSTHPCTPSHTFTLIPSCFLSHRLNHLSPSRTADTLDALRARVEQQKLAVQATDSRVGALLTDSTRTAPARFHPLPDGECFVSPVLCLPCGP